jgi:hypothetical protein
MGYILRAVFLLISVLPVIDSFGQVNLFKPKIIGQTPSPLTTVENQPITIKLTNLVVTDADPLPVYPTGFTLEINSGENYEVKDATVTPDKNFIGTLKVRVRVDDGEHNSDRFDLRIEVTESKNSVPIITGQEVLTTPQGQNFKIELTHLKVTDPDNTYPQDFTLHVFNGSNYAVSGNTITPNSNFTGDLKVPVSVNDGKNESEKFDLKIGVTKPQNTVPQITGQNDLKMNEDEEITIQLSNLKVTDPDNDYPKDFTLKIYAGSNYAVSGSKVTPSKNFFGTLSVSVTVNDGKADSAPFNLQITVNAVNDPPLITGQLSLSTNKNTPIPIAFSSLTVTDPDNNYPENFTLKISS